MGNTKTTATGLVLALLLTAGCDGGAAGGRETAAETNGAGGAVGSTVERADPLAGLEQGWNVIAPGGETVCSDGSEYLFFVRPADPRKLLVYFQGGGACWFGANCDPHLDPSYKPTVARDEMERYQGIFEFDNPQNPFADYSVVVAPYCTADVHIGDNVATYEAPARSASEDEELQEDHASHEITIHHRGVVNAQAVLDWTYRHFDAPADIFVTGSSAGAIPSPYYAWLIADHYPDARVAQLGDGAGGYRRSEDTNMERMQKWGTMEHLKQYPEFADMPIGEFRYEDLYIAAAKRHPNVLFAQYDAAEDAVQKRFLAMGGRETSTLRELLEANHGDIRAEVDNFRAYIAGGDSHTILALPEFYTFQVNGRPIRDWVADLAAYRDVENVSCDQCAEPELTESAATTEGGQ